MKTVLITGAGPTGVTGRAIKEYLQDFYEILSPSSKELDLTNDDAVRAYFDTHLIDFVVHTATFRSNISKTEHFVDEELESNLRMYFSLAAQSEKFEKMVYLGSGAEYDKTKPIINISEDKFGERIPRTKYGLSKYIMNQHCRSSRNIYNLRMFGTLNKYERYTKNVVCNLCAKAVMGLPLTLRQDVRFSWVDIHDVAKAINYMFEHEVGYHDYNIAIRNSYTLSQLAGIVKQVSNSINDVVFQQKGHNNEYTCSTERYEGIFLFDKKSVSESIKEIYDYLLANKEMIKLDAIDNRWK